MNELKLNSPDRVASYLDNSGKPTIEGIPGCVHPEIQYFDPLFGALEGQDVVRLRSFEASFNGFKMERGEIEDLGDGYYSCPWKKTYTYPVTGRKVSINGKSHISMDNGLVTGHSEAFSLHRWAKDAYGIAGWFFGSIFFFQRKMRREAARQLREFGN